MEKIHLYDKILSPVVTEKSTNLSEQNKIVFKVPHGANKKNLKKNNGRAGSELPSVSTSKRFDRASDGGCKNFQSLGIQIEN